MENCHSNAILLDVSSSACRVACVVQYYKKKKTCVVLDILHTVDARRSCLYSFICAILVCADDKTERAKLELLIFILFHDS